MARIEEEFKALSLLIGSAIETKSHDSINASKTLDHHDVFHIAVVDSMELDTKFVDKISYTVTEYAQNMASIWKKKNGEEGEIAIVQKADIALLRSLCMIVWENDVVESKNLKYACRVETETQILHVNGAPDAILKVGELKPLVWECKKPTHTGYNGVNTRQICFAMLNAVKIYELRYSRLPSRLCGILSSGRLFVLLQVRVDESGLLVWERSLMISLFNKDGRLDTNQCTYLAKMISHALVVAEEIVIADSVLGGVLMRSAEKKGDDDGDGEEEKREHMKKANDRSKNQTKTTSSKNLSKSQQNSSSGYRTKTRGGALLDVPFASLTSENVERNRRWRCDEEDRFKVSSRLSL